MDAQLHTSHPWLLGAALAASVLVLAHAQEGGLQRSTFLVGDVLVVWQAGRGTSVTSRGIPLFAPNASEFVVHHAWQDVYYRTENGHPEATLTEGAEEPALTIRDRAEHFAVEKRVIAHKDGTVRLEYTYELLDPESAELQGLFGIGKQWLHDAKYRVVAGGTERDGELKCPDAGRTDPFANATEQTFTTDFGTLTLTAQRGLNLYCTPQGGAVWWSQALKKGEKYTQTIEARLKPGPAAETGLALGGLKWPDRVRNGRVPFALQLAKTPGGSARVRVHAELATGSAKSVGEPVEAALTDTPTEVRCEATVDGKGRFPFAVVVVDAADGKERLRLAPLEVTSALLLRVLPRLSLYTSEKTADVVCDVADDVDLAGLTVRLTGEGVPEVTRSVAARRTALPVALDGLTAGVHALTCSVLRGEEVLAESPVQLRTAPPKTNEVKIDNLSRGLIVDGLPFIPFGYYTYYPLKEGVMDEEVVHGFNLFSPYHGGPHASDALQPIVEYLDRCAALGMKVNYHLMWSNRLEMTAEQWAALQTEIETIRDHPALLSWYIADEPAADRISHLEKVYQLVKELDPYHPVTVVFCQGADHARQFVGTMDIVMADPYPIPQGAVTAVNGIADALNDAFDFSKPLWIVPQCFGGGEWWRREPTAAEQRVMTYLALIHGATGIQYFIRSPRLSFPKSPIMWAECGTLALETAELTPALLSVEPQPEVKCSLPTVHVCACRDRGIVTLLAVNTENRPQTVRLELSGVDFTGDAEVLFEDRKVQVTAGAIEEPIDAFGRRAYAIAVGPLPTGDLSLDPDNLTVNPSYEQQPSVGTADGCYASIPPGATFFVDSRVARHGRHSLRLTAPTAHATPSLSPFPVSLKAGQEYHVSLWAKAKTAGVKLDLSLGKLREEQYALTTEWQEYSFDVKPEADMRRAGAGIALGSAGVAWVDLFQVVPVGTGVK